MKRIFAAIIAVLTLCALGTGAFALVGASEATAKNPPVFIQELVVSDAWMSGLTQQNWMGALHQQTYVEGSYIWFIAKISVSAYEDTDGARLWTNGDEEAVLTVTSKDNCLNFSSASIAHFARIQGMDVASEQVRPNLDHLIEATASRAVFTFRCQALANPPVIENETLVFPQDLENLRMDGIVPADVFGIEAHSATKQKDYYLHFMAIANAATEGVCSATFRIDNPDALTFLRDQGAQEDENAAYPTENWWEWEYGDTSSDSMLLPGDRSIIYYVDNTLNDKIYAIMKINGKATPASEALGWKGPYGNTGSIYVIMNQELTQCYIGFAVSGGRLQGTVHWDRNYRANGEPGAFGNALTNRKAWDAASYRPLTTNNNGNSLLEVDSDISINRREMRYIFNFHGIETINPGAIDDAAFLAPSTGLAGASRTARETTAEARYNVSSGDSEFDALFVNPTEGVMQPTPTPSPSAAPDFVLPGSPFGPANTPEPTASAVPEQ